MQTATPAGYRPACLQTGSRNVTRSIFSSRKVLPPSRHCRFRRLGSKQTAVGELSIFVTRFYDGRRFSQSAAYRSERHPFWIFVQNNSVKANPLRLLPDRRCEIRTEFSLRNEKARDAGFVTGKKKERLSWRKSLRCSVTAQICHGSVSDVV